MDTSGYTFTDHFGIREIRVTDDWQFFLNGRRFYIRGSNIIPTMWLSEYDEQMIATDIKQMRGAGLNGVRVCVHVNRREFYTACDEAGIVIWNDFALQWSYDDSDAFKANAVSQIQDFVRMLYNHPSIIVWACQNEPLHNKDILTPILEIAARQEDGTRHICPAATFSQHTYKGWYAATKEEYLAVPASPFCNEYGAQALPVLETMKSMFSEEELMPETEDHWRKWAYHDFQYDETFNVAGVERGSSIEEFIENSQQYQFDLVKISTEAFRQAKYNGMNSLFHFMFNDAWPAITWSVVDYYRRPKKGYEALKLACQPVLIMINKKNRYRTRVEVGKFANVSVLASISIVNDYHREFPDARIETSAEHMETGKVTELAGYPIHIPADSVVSLKNMLQVLEEPPEDRDPKFTKFMADLAGKSATLSPGRYAYRLKLFDADGNCLSENYEMMDFIEPVLSRPPPIVLG